MDDKDSIQMDVNDFKDESEVEAQDTTATEPSTEETKTPDAEPEPETEDTKPKEEETPEKESEPVEGEVVEETDEDGKPRAKNAAENRIRTLANTNRELRQQIEQLNSQNYQAATPEQLEEQGYDSTQAQIEAMRQERELDKFNAKVAQVNTDLNVEAIQVLNDYPEFDKDSKDYDANFASRVQRQYEKASRIQTDPRTGLVVQAEVLPYEFYKEFAEARREGMKHGAVKGQKSAEKQLSAAEVPSGAAPQKSESEDDPFLSGFNSKK